MKPLIMSYLLRHPDTSWCCDSVARCSQITSVTAFPQVMQQLRIWILSTVWLFTSASYSVSVVSTACFLAVSLLVADAEQHEKDHETLILLEVEPNVKSNSKDRRSPQHGSSQAVFAASPGQFIVRTSSPSGDTQAEVQPEYLNLLVGQQPEGDQTPPQPVLQQLLIARYKCQGGLARNQ